MLTFLRGLMRAPKTRPQIKTATTVLLLGLFLTCHFGLGPMIESYVIRSYDWHTCKVSETRTTGRARSFRPEVRVEYEIAGRAYDRWASDPTGISFRSPQAAHLALQPFHVGGSYRCYLESEHPDHVVILFAKELWPVALQILFGIGLLVMGARLLYYARWHAGTSTEHEADLPPEPAPARPARPGRFLNFALRPKNEWAEWAVLIGLLLFSTMPIFLGHEARWVTPWMALVAIPGGAVAVLSWAALMWRLVRFVGVPAAEIEVSDCPVALGQPLHIWLRQRGSFRLNSLHAKLVCTERVSFQLGKRRKTEVRELFSQTLFSEGYVMVLREVPFVWEGSWEMPRDIPPLCEGVNGAVVWTIVLVGDVVRMPNIRYEAVLHVAPAPVAAPAGYRDMPRSRDA